MHNESHEQDELPSKSELKRQMQALQEVGKKLLELNKNQLKTLQLDEELLEALAEYKRISSHEARRRQLQRIGKLMRSRDHEAIQAAMDIYDAGSETHARHFQQLELWRERLLAEDNALVDFMNEWPACEAQKIRQLIRNARQEQAAGKPPTNSRKLFRYLRDLCDPG
ncbi:ribosome biogenesis factor YjgA [Marinospirillum alkaliphilum]|uniref:Dual-action ribosomal maturation protein DarP n=1 Tax=Marinospirillum alkaliphilum DSM 21637 TaxID=1122209 RepID=A0A1K1TMG6_9GAMM|nr:ribosome biogenesis factor YjgA [Marinospirillum alkaliphilum]SFX01951.1 ribosome-associated protein [Marinospirillum alkaliphilum DSM 21637]